MRSSSRQVRHFKQYGSHRKECRVSFRIRATVGNRVSDAPCAQRPCSAWWRSSPSKASASRRSPARGDPEASPIGHRGRLLNGRVNSFEASRKKEKVKRTPHGRPDLTLTELPVERITLEPADRHLPGGELLEKIGEEVSEIIERRAAALVRVHLVRPKYKLPGSPLAQETAAAARVASRAEADHAILDSDARKDAVRRTRTQVPRIGDEAGPSIKHRVEVVQRQVREER